MRTGRARTFHSSGLRCLTPLRCCAGGSFIARARLSTGPATRGAHDCEATREGALFYYRCCFLGAVDPRTSSLSDARAPREMTPSALWSDAALGRLRPPDAPTPGRGGGTPVEPARPRRRRHRPTVWMTRSSSPPSSSTRRRPRWSTRARAPGVQPPRPRHPRRPRRRQPHPGRRAGQAFVSLDAFAPATRERVMEVHTKNYVGGLNVLAKTRAPMDVTGDTYITRVVRRPLRLRRGHRVDAVCDAAGFAKVANPDPRRLSRRGVWTVPSAVTTRRPSPRWDSASSARSPRRRGTRNARGITW